MCVTLAGLGELGGIQVAAASTVNFPVVGLSRIAFSSRPPTRCVPHLMSLYHSNHIMCVCVCVCVYVRSLYQSNTITRVCVRVCVHLRSLYHVTKSQKKS